LADEYKQSQSWLRSYGPPDFDEAFLVDLKSNVLKHAKEISTTHSLFAGVVQRWSRRQVLALSTALLIVFGILASYLYRAGVRVAPAIPEIAKQTPDENEVQDALVSRPATKEAPGAHSSRRQHPSRRYSNLKARAAETSNPGKATAQRLATQTGSAPGQGIDARRQSDGDFQEMLRIEIQTGDPNIRIIWFAPKEGYTQSVEPLTERQQ
jgi:hypothetical protein